MNLVFISAMVYAASSFRVCLFGLMLVTKLVACFRMMGGHRKWLYWLLAIMWPLFSFLIHMSLFRTSEWAMWEMGETLKRREGSCSVSFRHVQKVQRSALRLWLAVNTVGSDDAWGLMKLNFPVGASAAVFAWMPLCLYAPWPGFHAIF